MWKTAENGSDIKPASVDETSSKKYVYVRKDFTEVPSYDNEGNQTGTHWQYKENKVLKEDWEYYQTLSKNTANIDYLAMMMDIDL